MNNSDYKSQMVVPSCIKPSNGESQKFRYNLFTNGVVQQQTPTERSPLPSSNFHTREHASETSISNGTVSPLHTMFSEFQSTRSFTSRPNSLSRSDLTPSGCEDSSENNITPPISGRPLSSNSLGHNDFNKNFRRVEGVLSQHQFGSKTDIDIRRGGENYGRRRGVHSGRGGRRTLILPTPFPHGFLMTPYCTAPDRFLSRSHLMEVREAPIDLTNGSEWDQLSYAVWKKFLVHQQTEEIYKRKMTLWKFLYVYIKSCYPKYGLYLVGSTMSGFGGNCSDVDMCLLVRHAEIDQRNEALAYLTDILKILYKFDFIDKPELIQAKVPILKFRDITHGLEVDLNCNNSVGIRNTHLMYCYSQMDWRVKPLVIVVKLWAHWHDINDAKKMTISSYSLTLMVIHFLQYGVSPSVLPCLHLMYHGKFSSNIEIGRIDIHEELDPYYSQNKMPLGELLLKFFQYYTTFDFSTNAISVRVGSVVPIEDCRLVRTPKNDPHQWKYLCIEEPFDLTNTARSVYDADVFERICYIFKKSAEQLKETHALESIFKI